MADTPLETLWALQVEGRGEGAMSRPIPLHLILVLKRKSKIKLGRVFFFLHGDFSWEVVDSLPQKYKTTLLHCKGESYRLND